MSRESGGYILATLHPWPSFLFLLPLLLIYEGGVVWLGKAEADLLRNGADVWLRWGLGSLGMREMYWAPGLLVAAFLGWSWLRREDRPRDLFALWIGMATESIVFALGLWGVSLGLRPLVEGLGIELGVPTGSEQTIARAITFLGAGIYEEVIFRLLLYSTIAFVLRRLFLGSVPAALLAALVSALLFAAAHHAGPHGEAFDGYIFLFRTVAGIYFAFLFELRGFGIAATSHALYDVIVGTVVS